MICYLLVYFEVFCVILSWILRLKIIRVFDYLRFLFSFLKGFLYDICLGSEVIIGIIDLGIWLELELFKDIGLGLIL